jgi:hypothetical protein
MIRFELPTAMRVSLKIFDAGGKTAAVLVDGWRAAGSHEITFDGSGLPSGVYFTRLTAGKYTAVQKLVLVK